MDGINAVMVVAMATITTRSMQIGQSCALEQLSETAEGLIDFLQSLWTSFWRIIRNLISSANQVRLQINSYCSQRTILDTLGILNELALFLGELDQSIQLVYPA
jgi:hypothetical protein